jgi:hypothetical protein
MRTFRLLMAFIIAPFAGPLIGIVIGSNAANISDALTSLYLFTYTSIGILRYFGWALTLLLMVPIYLLMRRFGWSHWWQIVLAWAVVQSLPAIVALFVFPGVAVFLVTCFVEGAVDGVIFRLIAGHPQHPWPARWPLG